MDKGDKHNRRSALKQQTKAFHPSAWKQDIQNQAQRVNANEVLDSESEEEVVYQLTAQGLKNSLYTARINNVHVSVIADSGSTITLLDQEAYSSLGSPPLITTTVMVFTYGATQPLPLLGKLNVMVSYHECSVNSTVFVCPGNNGNLLSGKLPAYLGILNMANTISERPTNSNIPEEQLKFPGLFKGIGKLKNFTVKLHIDTSITLVANAHRRIPLHLRKATELELQHVVEMDIIEPLEGPTPWVSPVVVVTKPHDNTKIRICVDMKQANKAIQRERHTTPTLDDILSDLNGAVMFSALDLSHGYRQLELDESSRFITTFSTHVGLWR